MRLIIILLLLTILTHGQNPTKKKSDVMSSEDFNVSLIQLIATPEKYNGKLIQVIGYINLEFEGNAIYLHKEDYENGLTRNSFWVDFSEKITSSKKINDYSKGYVIIVGTFDMKSKGHMGMFGGTIKNITRLDYWRTRSEK